MRRYNNLFGQPYASFSGKFNKEYTKQIICRLFTVWEMNQRFKQTLQQT